MVAKRSQSLDSFRRHNHPRLNRNTGFTPSFRCIARRATLVGTENVPNMDAPTNLPRIGDSAKSMD